MVEGYAREAMAEIASFIFKAIDVISEDEKNKMVEELVDAYRRGARILVMGAGRSGLVGKAFAMRLLHMGFQVYVLGETIVPRIREGDLVVAISGSGRTRLIVTAAEAAKTVGAKVIAITTYPDSPLGKIADIIVRIPGRTKIAKEEDYFTRQILGIHEPLAPLGTLFEDTTMVFLDGIVVELMKKLGKTEEDLKNEHANIEL
ncbi:hexulose-6-phosphate isomerase [Staphylothermus marinus F1]|uniref:Hexulose-6-phosphate isomerase n=1 Tax=Staphylothermus marinus (strain ATCC 43588 / DSM 3639 / JCM 9404 / F1) TaxID=399550 RepID=A3DLI7_STAMF|nr:6-phospho-3-hexuloisomerase [Staphylothermus marinus]ABN69497.1 hexulose-6-phosphate isomerase [Staphylothermus marinus F1]